MTHLCYLRQTHLSGLAKCVNALISTYVRAQPGCDYVVLLFFCCVASLAAGASSPALLCCPAVVRSVPSLLSIHSGWPLEPVLNKLVVAQRLSALYHNRCSVHSAPAIVIQIAPVIVIQIALHA